MAVYDNVKKVMIDDATIESIAKAQIAGEDVPVTKGDWMIAIEERADTIYADRGMTKEQRFSKAVGGFAEWARGSVVNDGDRLCKLYYDAMKVAPRAVVEKTAPEAPVDTHDALAKARGPAHERMLDAARRYKATFPNLTDEQAYTRAFTDPKLVHIKAEMVREQSWDAGLENVPGQTNNPIGRASDYRNPHRPATA